MPPAGPARGRKEHQRNKLSSATTSMMWGKLKTQEIGKKYIICQVYHVSVTFVVPCSEKQGSDLSWCLSVNHKERHRSAVFMVRRWNCALKRKAHYEMQPDLIFNMMVDPLTHSLLVFAFRRSDSFYGRNQNNITLCSTFKWAPHF